MLRAIVVIGVLSGCLHPNTVDCDNGITCPVALVCDDAHGGCVAGAQIAACNGLPDLSPCQTDLVNGVCHEGVCLPASCGNGRIDPPEVRRAARVDCAVRQRCRSGLVHVSARTRVSQ